MAERNDQQEIRLQRRRELIDAGVDVYPSNVGPVATIATVREPWRDETPVRIAGRIRAMRLQGGSAFLDLDDGTGTIQLFLQKQKLGEAFTMTKQLDLGDFVAVNGSTFTTKAGEPSVGVDQLTWLAKALRPLPSSWHGLEDVELRYRHRELELVTDEGSRELVRKRARIVRAIREFLDAESFIEVETPVLQPIAGGATAQPFVTHHRALDIDLYLRIAPELYLKRLVVGGLNRVFEIARCFRNEGIDRDHNPEFTQVELYAAYQDYRWLMTLTERLLIAAATAANGRPVYLDDGQEVTLTAPFPRVTYHDVILQHAAIDIDVERTADGLRRAARAIGTDVPDDMSWPKMVDEVFKTHVRPKLITPTFVHDYPVELSPLAKKKLGDPRYTERFQILFGGTELGNAFSELNDPVDQRERFEAQEKLRAAGDDEAQRIDEDFLQALEYGLPPTAGLGIGIDRLTAVLTGQKNLKEVILFPTLKPRP